MSKQFLEKKRGKEDDKKEKKGNKNCYKKKGEKEKKDNEKRKLNDEIENVIELEEKEKADLKEIKQDSKQNLNKVSEENEKFKKYIKINKRKIIKRKKKKIHFQEATSIKKYIENKKNELKNEKISLNDYLEIIDIDDENIKILLNSLLNENNEKIFLKKYEKYQFRLKLKDRLLYQKYFEQKENLPESIKKNIIEKDSIKDMFKKICVDITINIYNKKIETIFEDNHIYFDDNFDINIPNRFGTNELKFYCILYDIYCFFNNNNLSFEQKREIFFNLDELFYSLDNLSDYEAIKVFNYLINILYIYTEVGQINTNEFEKIIKSCLPFNKEKANSLIKYLKKIKVKFLKINGIYPYELNEIEIKKDDKITLETEKFTIEINAEFINWNFDNTHFENSLKNGYFMLCIRYPYNNNYNCFTINSNINSQLNSLFNEMIKSEPVKKAMLFDVESNKLDYLLKKEEIINEVEEGIHLVILPFSNYHGFTDRASFDIYLDIFINYSNDCSTILSKFEFFLISKLHEYKHSSRIYLKIFNNSNIETPFKIFNKAIKNKIKESKKIISAISVNHPSNSIIFQNSTKEYGEGFEIALFGYKVECMFLKSIIFCLQEESWKLNDKLFYQEFKETMTNRNNVDLKTECKEGILLEIYTFFDFAKKNKVTANIIIENKSSNKYYNKNEKLYLFIPRISHHLYRDENKNKWK